MKRQNNKQEITRLISKFMAGETSVAEEQVLAQYFRTHEVDEAWAEYKEMFALFDSGQVDIEPDALISEQPIDDDSGKIRTLPKAVREKPKIVALRWFVAAVAASVLLLLVFRFTQHSAEEKPAVAEVEKKNTPQPVTPSTETEKEKETVADAQPTPQTMKLRRRAARKRSTQEKPMLAKAEPQQEEPTDNADAASTHYPSIQDPFLLAAAQAQDIRSRGERLHQEVALLMNNP